MLCDVMLLGGGGLALLSYRTRFEGGLELGVGCLGIDSVELT